MNISKSPIFASDLFDMAPQIVSENMLENDLHTQSFLVRNGHSMQ